MSNEIAILALRLQGPMQSWGHNSQFNRRDTALFPTKSALVGLCCAAMGINRGSGKEQEILKKFTETKLLCIAIPCKQKKREVAVKRMLDYHTVKGTRDAKGSIKTDAVLTYRQYLNDADFIALLEGEKAFLNQIAESLRNPVWGVWLGRKTCIPSAPVFAGIFDSENDAVNKLLEGKSLDEFSCLREVDTFGQGIDSLMDQAISFESTARRFVPRRVLLKEVRIK